MAIRFSKISSNGNKILKSNLMTAPSYMIIFNFSFLFSIDEFSQEVRDLLYQAINDLLEMDGQMAPQDKMASLVKCSKNIFEMLKLSNETPASADDFLPCLIYICLKANPPRIQSNINFITRFCNENKLRMGEGGYFFANLVSLHYGCVHVKKLVKITSGF